MALFHQEPEPWAKPDSVGSGLPHILHIFNTWIFAFSPTKSQFSLLLVNIFKNLYSLLFLKYNLLWMPNTGTIFFFFFKQLFLQTLSFSHNLQKNFPNVFLFPLLFLYKTGERKLRGYSWIWSVMSFVTHWSSFSTESFKHPRKRKHWKQNVVILSTVSIGDG